MLSCNYQRLSFWKVLSYTYKRLNHFAVALCLLFVTAPVFAALSAEDYDSDQFRAFIDTIRNPGHMGQLFLGTNIQKKVFQGKDKNTLVSKLIAAGVVNKSQLTAINGGMISNPSIPERMLNLLTESANVRGFHSKLMELLHEDHQFGLQGIALQIDNLYQTYLTNAQSQDTSTDHNDSNHVHIVPPTDLHSGNPPAYTDELMQVDPRDQAPPLVNKRPFMEQQQYPEPTYLPRTTTTTDTTSRTFLPPTAPPVGYMSPPAGYIPPAGGYMSPGRYPQQGGHIPPQTPGIPTNQVVVTVQPPVPTSTTALPSVNPTVIPTTVDHPTPAPRNTRPTNTATPADTTIAMAGILGSVTAQIKQQQQQQESINAQLQSSKQLGINDLEAIAISLGTSRTMDNMFAGMQNQTFDSIAKFVAEAVLSAAGNDWQKFTMPIINFMQSTVKKAPFITQIFNPLSEIEKGKMILKLYQLLILSELPCGSITQQIREQIVAISPNCDLSVLTSGISAQIKPAALFSNYNFIIYNYLVSENTSFNQLTINDPMALLQRLSEKSGVILQSGRANISNLSTFILTLDLLLGAQSSITSQQQQALFVHMISLISNSMEATTINQNTLGGAHPFLDIMNAQVTGSMNALTEIQLKTGLQQALSNAKPEVQIAFAIITNGNICPVYRTTTAPVRRPHNSSSDMFVQKAPRIQQRYNKVPANVQISGSSNRLIDILNQRGRGSLSKQELIQLDRSGPYQDEAEFELDEEEAKRQMGIKWVDLARRLQIHETEIEEIQEDAHHRVGPCKAAFMGKLKSYYPNTYWILLYYAGRSLSMNMFVENSYYNYPSKVR